MTKLAPFSSLIMSPARDSLPLQQIEHNVVFWNIAHQRKQETPRHNW